MVFALRAFASLRETSRLSDTWEAIWFYTVYGPDLYYPAAGRYTNYASLCPDVRRKVPRLRDILRDIEIVAQEGSDDLVVDGVQFDSRSVAKNDLFVAVKGTRVDGHQFIARAIDKGAAAIICETLPADTPGNVTFFRVKSSDAALGIAASNFFHGPSRRLKLLGVTGTNGKTTIATSLFRLFRELGYRAGLLSTVQNQINDKVVAATHTTPDAIQINRLLGEMVDEGCEYCFMEVSSHSLTQYRTSGLSFAGGIFSNLSQDHLDYHETFEQYVRAKKSFFDRLPPSAFALINADDPHGPTMLEDCRAKRFSFGMNAPSNFNCRVLESRFDGTLLNMDGSELKSGFIGEFNASNLLAVYAAAILLTQPRDRVLSSMSALGSVAGRFEYVRSRQGVTVIIDYAHTPDALKNVLQTINGIRSGREQVITVVGAGGDRDRTKRPLMAQIVAQLSDRVVLTSDNPRSEDPARILSDMYDGVGVPDRDKVLQILDRKQGIAKALTLADPGDIVLVAGKGHENYQEIKGVRTHFDDKEVVLALFG